MPCIIAAMTRTTLNIEDNVLIELRELAHRERKSLGRLVSDLLAAELAAETPSPPPHQPGQ